jgi:hypothetical protein
LKHWIDVLKNRGCFEQADGFQIVGSDSSFPRLESQGRLGAADQARFKPAKELYWRKMMISVSYARALPPA